MASERASVEVSARTVEDAVEQGLRELGVSREDVEIEILNPGRGGLLGLGAQDAQVRLTRLVAEETRAAPMLPELTAEEEGKPEEAPTGESVVTTEASQLAVELLQGLIDRMGIRGEVAAHTSQELVEEGDAPALVLDVTGKDLGILIGRQAETLQALQYLVRLMLSKQLARWEPVVVDVESYRARRRRSLRRLALRMAERATSSHRRVILEAMPAHERRIIHLALQDHPGVGTKSIGEGDHRKVTIIPK
jgi:spoIIIJ-associated protein